MSERDKAQPNVYLSGDRTTNHQPSDEKELKGEDLIVNTEPTEIQQPDIEITLEAVNPEGANRIPNASETSRTVPNAAESPNGAENDRQGGVEWAWERESAGKRSICELHNNSRGPSYTTCCIMQRQRNATAFSRAAESDYRLETIDHRGWSARPHGDCLFTHHNSDVEMKRSREDSSDGSFSQRDADWGWISLSRDRQPANECDHVTSCHHNHHRCSCLTTQRGRDRWSPWRTCRGVTSQSRSKRAMCCQNNGCRTVTLGRRFRTSAAVLFTIVDEDALERRPRVLEFGSSWVEEQPPQLTTPQHCHGDCVHCAVTMHSDGMDWNEEYEGQCQGRFG